MRECPVIGHERCRGALEAEMPLQPVLLLGPESTGKWLLARWLADFHAVWFNQWSHDKPGIEQIREMRRFLAFPPRPGPATATGGQVKVVTICLDGARSVSVQHALLKELEEPSSYARFLITSSRSPLPTVSSRCLIWRLGHLTDDQVSDVLVSQGFSPKDAASLAPIGAGRVSPALVAAKRFRPARQAVLGVVKAIATRDKDLLERAVRDWGETEDWMLRELLGSSATGRPTPVFTSSERMAIGRTAARRGIALLAASGKARPQVAVRALAVALMEGR
jgi:DNA polymerase III delta subunit-like protein